MRIDLNSFFGVTRDWTIKIWVGDALIQHQVVQMNEMMAEQEFRQLVNKLARENQPMKCKFYYPYYTPMGENEDYIEFTNKKWDLAHAE